MVGKRRVPLWRPFVMLLALFALVASSGAAAGAAPAASSNGERVKIIGVFEDSVSNPRAAAQDLERRHNGRLSFVYEHALKGFAGEFPQASLSGLERDPRVDYVELDQVVTIAQQDTPTGVQRIFADTNGSIDIDGNDDFRVDADVAVLDTGIDFEHPDLNVVVSGSRNCATGGPWSTSCSSGGDDDQYHGTHVAGTIGALDNGDGVVGVAPGVRLWSVKVLNSQGSGYMSWIAAGIDYVTSKATQIEVANMSLGCECSSTAVTNAITNSVAAGVVFAVAAGNSSKDADTFFPANHPDVIAVSAIADFNGAPGGGAASTCRSDVDDTLANFSNYGDTVAIAAPGVCIRSTYPIEKGSYGTISGTSMASPHVAGAAALLTSSSKPTTQAQALSIRSTLQSAGNLNWVEDRSNDPQERLLDVSTFSPRLVDGPGTGGGDGGTEPTPVTPTTVSVGDLACADAGKNGRDFLITLGVDSASGPVAGANVSVRITVDTGGAWTGSGTTGNSGEVTFKIGNAPAGTYTTQVTALTGDGLEWDSVQPDPNTCVRTTSGGGGGGGGGKGNGKGNGGSTLL